jgi:polysaccharide export outer membrane protein
MNMKNHNNHPWCFLVLLAVALGLGISQALAADDAASKEDAVTNFVGVLQVGDGIKITTSGNSFLEGKSPIEQKIKDDGTISLEHLGTNGIKAAGLTASQLEYVIYTNYVPRIYKRFSVSVGTENRYFYVGGQVRKPDRFPYVAEITVSKAIDSAGGFTEFAKKGKVQVIRLSGKVENVDCEAALKDPRLDLPIYPGDRIFVDRRWM